MSKRQQVIGDLQNIINIEAGSTRNDQIITDSMGRIADAILHTGDFALNFVQVTPVVDRNVGEGGNADSTVGNDIEADGKVSASLTETLPHADKQMQYFEDVPISGTGLAKKPETLLVFYEYCDAGDGQQCPNVRQVTMVPSTWKCVHFKTPLSFSSGGLLLRCVACKDPKTGYPNGLRLEGVK